MKITFHGAARTVTGSKHLIETATGKKILLDCGFFQGRRKESAEKNQNFAFNPAEISSVILSHAHIDHSGSLPTLVKKGYKGDIFSTFATRDLCHTMLQDSGHIQETDAKYFTRRPRLKAIKPIEPLYTVEDAITAMGHFRGVNFHQPFWIHRDIQAEFLVAGHVLGSALTKLTIKENSKIVKIGFTGDLGRKGLPILRDPEFFDDLDYLITESTYGDRLHEPIEDSKAQLAKAINRTVKRGGKIIIPAFSLERTQELVYDLHLLTDRKEIPELPIYIDSPLSGNITQIFKMHPECYDKETRTEFRRENPFGFGKLRYTHSAEESKKLNEERQPCIIISASGMCEAGRIRHHLRNNITDPKNTVLIVGFMAENTLGRKLVEKNRFIKIFDKMYPLRAEVIVLNSFSAHADRDELLKFIKPIQNLKKVFVVHGEEGQAMAFANTLREWKKFEVAVPFEGESFDLMNNGTKIETEEIPMGQKSSNFDLK